MDYWGYIYKITNKTNGKIYIGQTTRTIEERWAEHIRNSNCPSATEYPNKFHRAIRKYSSGGFIVEQVEEIKSNSFSRLKQKLDKAEIKWISHYDSKNKGYNSTYGGDINPMFGVRGEDNPCSKKVNQYDLEGHFIKTWGGMGDIAREFNTTSANICRVCQVDNMNDITCKGFFWRYYDEFPDCKDIDTKPFLEIRNKAKNKGYNNFPTKKVDKYDKEGNLLASFNSIGEAAKEINGNYSAFSRSLVNGRSYHGFYYKYHK